MGTLVPNSMVAIGLGKLDDTIRMGNGHVGKVESNPLGRAVDSLSFGSDGLHGGVGGAKKISFNLGGAADIGFDIDRYGVERISGGHQDLAGLVAQESVWRVGADGVLAILIDGRQGVGMRGGPPDNGDYQK